MIRLHLILVLLIGMIGPAAAAVPRACLFAGGPEAVPFLTAQGPPILVGDVDLDSQSAVTPYKVRTFSDTAKREQYRSEQCLRYEVENIDNRTIRSFYWGLAGMWIDPFEPAARRSKVLTRQLLDDPIDIRSRVNAFENSKGTTHAWADRRTGDRLASINGPAGSGFAFVEPATIDARLGDFLRNGGLLDVPTAAYVFASNAEKAPVVSDSYSGQEFNLYLETYAARAGPTIILTTWIYSSGKPISDAQFLMPALFSLSEIEFNSYSRGTAPDPLRPYQEFLELYKKLRSSERPNEGKWFFTTKFQISDILPARAFLIKHPIVIKRGSSRECIIVTSFAPIAVNFPIVECQTLGAN